MKRDMETSSPRWCIMLRTVSFFNVQQEVVRPLMCDDNMEVNALRVLLFSLARSLKEREEGDLDSVDETYYESDDVIYMHKEDIQAHEDDIEGHDEEK